jgi:hypothetical protein
LVGVVVGGLITTIVPAALSYVFSADPSALSVQFASLDIPNPLHFLWLTDHDHTDLLGNLAKLPNPIAHDFAQRVIGQAALKIITIEITNPPGHRSGGIDISTPSAVLWHVGDERDTRYSLSETLHIDPVAPDTTTVITAVATAGAGVSAVFRGFAQAQIQILENGRQITLRPQLIDSYQDPFALGRLTRTHPLLTFYWLLASVFGACFLLIRLVGKSVTRWKNLGHPETPSEQERYRTPTEAHKAAFGLPLVEPAGVPLPAAPSREPG